MLKMYLMKNKSKKMLFKKMGFCIFMRARKCGLSRESLSNKYSGLINMIVLINLKLNEYFFSVEISIMHQFYIFRCKYIRFFLYLKEILYIVGICYLL